MTLSVLHQNGAFHEVGRRLSNSYRSVSLGKLLHRNLLLWLSFFSFWSCVLYRIGQQQQEQEKFVVRRTLIRSQQRKQWQLS